MFFVGVVLVYAAEGAEYAPQIEHVRRAQKINIVGRGRNPLNES